MLEPDRSRSGRRPPPPVPVVVLTGFLGAGKTTLLNDVLRGGSFAKTVVLINEFGEIGLDHLLVERVDGDMLLLASGCLCCTIRGDLVNALEGLLRRLDNGRIAPFDRVIIETTGLADPVPVLQTILGHPYLSLRFALDRVVTVVDAVNGLTTLEHHAEALRQVALADRLVVTKTDLPDAQENDLRTRLRELNARAPIIVRNGVGDVEDDLFLGDGNAGVARAKLPHDHASDHHHHDHDTHAHGPQPPQRDDPRFHARARHAADRDATHHLPRSDASHAWTETFATEGFCRAGDDPDRPLLVQAVQHILHPPMRLEKWPDADHRTRIVLIGDGLDEATVERLFGAVCGDVAPDRPDLAAMTANPLAAPPAGGLLG